MTPTIDAGDCVYVCVPLPDFSSLSLARLLKRVYKPVSPSSIPIENGNGSKPWMFLTHRRSELVNVPKSGERRSELMKRQLWLGWPAQQRLWPEKEKKNKAHQAGWSSQPLFRLRLYKKTLVCSWSYKMIPTKSKKRPKDVVYVSLHFWLRETGHCARIKIAQERLPKDYLQFLPMARLSKVG